MFIKWQFYLPTEAWSVLVISLMLSQKMGQKSMRNVWNNELIVLLCLVETTNKYQKPGYSTFSFSVVDGWQCCREQLSDVTWILFYTAFFCEPRLRGGTPQGIVYKLIWAHWERLTWVPSEQISIRTSTLHYFSSKQLCPAAHLNNGAGCSWPCPYLVNDSWSI